MFALIQFIYLITCLTSAIKGSKNHEYVRSLKEKEEGQSPARTLSGWAVEKDPGGNKKSEGNVGEIRGETKRRLQFSI